MEDDTGGITGIAVIPRSCSSVSWMVKELLDHRSNRVPANTNSGPSVNRHLTSIEEPEIGTRCVRRLHIWISYCALHRSGTNSLARSISLASAELRLKVREGMLLLGFVKYTPVVGLPLIAV